MGQAAREAASGAISLEGVDFTPTKWTGRDAATRRTPAKAFESREDPSMKSLALAPAAGGHLGVPSQRGWGSPPPV
jgi:hypothetical protein